MYLHLSRWKEDWKKVVSADENYLYVLHSMKRGLKEDTKEVYISEEDDKLDEKRIERYFR